MGLNSNSLDAKSLRHVQNDSESHTWREERDKERDMSVSVRLILRGYYATYDKRGIGGIIIIIYQINMTHFPSGLNSKPRQICRQEIEG